MNKLRLALTAVAAFAAAPSVLAQATTADTSASALHWAAHHNDLGAVKRLLDEGADPNLANRFGFTPLHEAASRCSPSLARAKRAPGTDTYV